MEDLRNNIFHYNIEVRGRVQGVGYRYSAQNQARVLGIKGFVKNMQRGSVYLEIEGTKTATDLMINWCQKGPGTGKVDDLEIVQGPVVNYNTFVVQY